MRCRHCKGTGEAPDKIVLECVGCQCKVTVVYNDTAELIAKSEYVLCAECRKHNDTHGS